MEPPTTDAGTRPGPLPRPPAPPGGRPGPRRLRRRPKDGHIAGVCAGVAEYFNVDPVIVRIAAVVLAFSGSGVIAYILAWIFVPEAKFWEPNANRGTVDRRDRGTQIFGIVLLALALSVIWGDWWSPAGRWFLPMGLVALGGWLLLRGDPEEDDDVTLHNPRPDGPTAPWAGTPTATTATTPMPTAPAGPEAGDEDPPIEDGDAPADADTTEVDPAYGAGAWGWGAGDGGPPSRPPWDVEDGAAPNGTPHTHRRRRLVGPVVFGALLIWAGAAWLLGVSPQSVLAVGLCIIGLGFVLGAFVGGTRSLILPAIVVGTALALTATIDIPLSGPIGDRTWRPQGVEDVAGRYELSIGEGTLDLRNLDVPEGDEVTIEATVGVGHLLVEVPEGLAVDVQTDVGAGDSVVFGVGQDGLGVTSVRHDDTGATGGTLVLELQVGLGQVEVVRVDPPDDGDTLR